MVAGEAAAPSEFRSLRCYMFRTKSLEVIVEKLLDPEKLIGGVIGLYLTENKLIELLFVNLKHYGHMIGMLLSAIDFIIIKAACGFNRAVTYATQYVRFLLFA